ncbi:MAG: hypothetical protein AAFQ67_03740 [Pseudomonadota bacterium]
MKARDLGGLGAASIVIGVTKLLTHTPSYDPLVASICRTPDSLAAFDPSRGFWESHCWGCPIALIGVFMFAIAGWQAASERKQRTLPA